MGRHGEISCYALIMKLDHTYIYGLLDECEGVIRYIGKTINIRKRYGEHLNSKNNRNKEMSEWIVALQKKNKRPMLVILDCIHDEQSSEAEQFWINHFLAIGCDLINVKINEKRRVKV